MVVGAWLALWRRSRAGLILLSIAMFVLEINVTSYGMLTLGGVLCLVFGSIMLIPGPIPEMKVPLEVILPVCIALALFCALVVRLAVRAQRVQVGTGVEGLIGEAGSVTVTVDCGIPFVGKTLAEYVAKDCERIIAEEYEYICDRLGQA